MKPLLLYSFFLWKSIIPHLQETFLYYILIYLSYRALRGYSALFFFISHFFSSLFFIYINSHFGSSSLSFFTILSTTTLCPIIYFHISLLYYYLFNLQSPPGVGLLLFSDLLFYPIILLYIFYSLVMVHLSFYLKVSIILY